MSTSVEAVAQRGRCCLVTVFCVLALACSSNDDGPLFTTSAGDGAEEESGVQTTDPTGGTDTESGSEDGGGTAPPTDTDGAEDESSTGSGDVKPGAFDGCPDELPEGWVFCEDFERDVNMEEVFFEYQDADGAFAVVGDKGASGTHSMRATYEAGIEAAGWISVSFGENPIIYGERPQYESTQNFEEIYWRIRVQTEAGWPDVGPHKLTRATAFAKEDWGQAMIAHLWSNGDGVTLLGEPTTCVTGGSINCQGFNDTTGLQSLGQLPGKTPIFSEDYSGDWHCVEGHVALNTPGEPDGVFEYWVDDDLENAAYDLNWRGTWTDYGLNLVAVENFWDGGAPRTLKRWVDDIAISTERIGCE